MRVFNADLSAIMKMVRCLASTLCSSASIKLSAVELSFRKLGSKSLIVKMVAVRANLFKGDKMNAKKTFSASFVYACGVFSIFMFCLWLLLLIASLLLPWYGVNSAGFRENAIACAYLWIFSFIAAASSIGTRVSFYDDKVIFRRCRYFKKEIAISDIDCYHINPFRVITLIVKGKPLRLPLMLPHTVTEIEEYLKTIGVKGRKRQNSS